MVRVPTIVYRKGGKDKHFSKWGPWSSKGVNTLEEYNQALADGWHTTQAEAFGLVEKPQPARVLAAVEEGETFADEAPPTREEMIAKAGELGIQIDKRWSDKTLAGKILEAMR